MGDFWSFCKLGCEQVLHGGLRRIQENVRKILLGFLYADN